MVQVSRVTVTVALPLLAYALGACANGSSSTPRGLDLRIAPLDLAGVGVACYDVRVDNDDGVVWSIGSPTATLLEEDRPLCSDRYGNGPGGSIAYVGTCDADSDTSDRPGVQNRVTLWVDGLYNATKTADIGDWRDPCPGGCALEVDCVENEDTRVDFDLTILRAAKQGFFDVAVDFGDIFCSAKLDSCDDDLQAMRLLFGADGVRDWTAVFGLACSAGTDAAKTVIEYGAIAITCGETTFVVDPKAGPGNASVTVAGHTLHYGVYRGAEDLACGEGAVGSCNKVYWNLAFSLDDLAALGGGCTLSLAATATDDGEGFTNGVPTADGVVYPYITVDAAPLTAGGAPICQQHPLGDGPVQTSYLGNVAGVDAPIPVCAQYDGDIAEDVPGTTMVGATCVACDLDGFYGGGSGTTADPYLICTRAHLEHVAANPTASFKQLVDLDLSAAPFVPLGVEAQVFAGDYDGNGKTLSALSIVEPTSTRPTGLFRQVAGKVHDLVVEGASVTGNNYSGTIAGRSNSGTIEDITVVDGDIIAKASAGGIVGHNFGGALRRVAFAGSVYSSANGTNILGRGGENLDAGAGGITGISYGGTVSDCVVDADVTWSPTGPGQVPAWTFAGGVVAYAPGVTFERCTTSGTINGYYAVGGVIGTFEGGTTLTDCHSDADVNGFQWVGGFSGLSRGDITRGSARGAVAGSNTVGGFTGVHVGGIISQSFATGDVEGSELVGGFSGDSVAYRNFNVPRFFDSWSSGAVLVTGVTGRGGGFIGRATDRDAQSTSTPPVVERCASFAPSVVAGGGSSDVYGFYGSLIGPNVFASDYYLLGASVPPQSASGLTGLESSAAILSASYVGFDFVSVWRMSSTNPLTGLATPVLAWQCGEHGVTCL